MSRAKPPARKRIGRVSLYLHRRQWYAYYRQTGRAVRQPLCTSECEAEVRASLINARLAADTAGVRIAEVARELMVGEVPGPDAVGPSIAVAELRQKFLHHHEHVLRSSMNTVARYTTATRHLEAFCQSHGLTDALGVPVQGFVEHLRTVEVTPNGHGNAIRRRLLDKGVRYILETCRSMYHFGLKRGHLPRQQPNPFSEIGLGQLRIRDAKSIFVFSAEQELAFFRAADPWAFAVHFTLAKTGLRSGELVHLLVEDIDLTQGWLHIRGKPELGWVTKTNRERRVPLVEPVVQLLAAVVAGRTQGVVFRRPRFTRSGRLAQCDRAALSREVARRQNEAQQLNSAPLTRQDQLRTCAGVWREAGAIGADDVRTCFIRTARRAGLPATCPKSWRHTFATLLQEANVDLLVRQETLGHRPSSPELSALGMTGVYTHTAPEVQRREIERAIHLRGGTLELMLPFLIRIKQARTLGSANKAQDPLAGFSFTTSTEVCP